MIELFLIILSCFLLAGMVFGHWMVFGGPNLKFFTSRKKPLEMRKPEGKKRLYTEPVTGPPQSLSPRGVTVKNHNR